ncbi:MAG: 16S rRNA (cytosine(967)-C(5))-methyltransferase RsmB [Bacteroidota bacterium]|nr:16S rRNA (cytosine(967)-C(5))-methyltransferase RsmB [Bacteroidota bacterium]
MTTDAMRMEQQAEYPPEVYKGVRGTAVKILTRIERTDAYLDRLLDAEMAGGEFNPLDKRLLNELVHGVMRNLLRLDWVLTSFYRGAYGKIEPEIRNALRVGLYQILFLTRIPHHAAVNEAVEFVKRFRGQKPADTINGLLRNIARNIENIHYPLASGDEFQYLSVVHSHPMWLVRRWHARYGFEQTESLLKANNMRPFLTLRYNPLRTDYRAFLETLTEMCIDYRRCFFLEDYVTVRNLPNIRQTRAFLDGLFTIQDESQGLVGRLLAPRPGETVYDLCAAPGGKSVHAAEMMRNEGRIVAVDLSPARLGLVRATAERLGITIIETVEGDASIVDLPPADKVLVDAPCTGLGVLCKKPDIKWKREQDDIRKMAEIQRTILDHAAHLVRPGGVLVYSTCTTEPEENAWQMRSFLERHPEFSVENARAFLAPQLVTGEGFMETLPHRHRMDGAFAARVARKK